MYQFLLDARRLKLFGELSTIYPICKVSRDPTDRSSGAGLLRSSSNVSSAAGAGDEDCYSIRGVELPLLIDNRWGRREDTTRSCCRARDIGIV